jgi:hypothetical protein
MDINYPITTFYPSIVCVFLMLFIQTILYEKLGYQIVGISNFN